MENQRVTRSLLTIAHGLVNAPSKRVLSVAGKGTLTMEVSPDGNKTFTLSCVGFEPVVKRSVDNGGPGRDVVRAIADQLVGMLASTAGVGPDSIVLEGGKAKRTAAVKLAPVALKPLELKAKK